MSKAPKDLRIPIMMSSAEVEAIDEWRFANKIATRAEAVRRLCLVALTIFDGKDAIFSSKDGLIQALKDINLYVADLDNDLNDAHDFFMQTIERVGDGAIEFTNIKRAIELAFPNIPDDKVMEGSTFLRNLAAEGRDRVEKGRRELYKKRERSSPTEDD